MDFISIISISHRYTDDIAEDPRFGQAVWLAICAMRNTGGAWPINIMVKSFAVGKVEFSPIPEHRPRDILVSAPAGRNTHCYAVAIVRWGAIAVATEDQSLGRSFASEILEHPAVDDHWSSVFTSNERSSQTAGYIVATLAPGHSTRFDHTKFGKTELLLPARA